MRKQETKEPLLTESNTGQTPKQVCASKEQCAPLEINMEQEPAIDENDDPLT